MQAICNQNVSTLGVYGYVEAKPLDLINRIRLDVHRGQIDRYLTLGHRLIITDGIEFCFLYPDQNPARFFSLLEKPAVGQMWTPNPIYLDLERIFRYFFSDEGFRRCSEERLIEEVLWSFAKPTFDKAIKETPGTGVEHIVGAYRRFMTDLSNFEAMRRFILQNPTAAIRIQTNKDPQSAHSRLIAATAVHLAEQVSRGLQLPAPGQELAEMIVYTNGALLYSAIIGDRAPAAIEQACVITRMLLTGMLPDDQTHSPQPRRAKTAHSLNTPRGR